MMLLIAASVNAATVVVDPSNVQGWAVQTGACAGVNTSGAQYVTGPPTAPAGVGSLRMTVGSNGDSYYIYRNTAFDGVLASQLTSLSYDTFVATYVDSQAIAINLKVDTDNDGVSDDTLWFEPAYQGAAYFPSNPQGPLSVGIWQHWNALNGGWYSENGAGGSGPGSNVKSLATILADLPVGTKIAPSSIGGLGGLRLYSGCGAGSWDNFDGNVDNLMVGVAGVTTTYDFDPDPVAPGINQAVYNSVPAVLAPSYPSQPFQAQQTNEFGDYVHMAGSSRVLDSVTLTMVTWAYQSEAGNVAYCAAHPSRCSGSGWTHDFTLNIYNIGSGTVGTRSVGSLIATVTQSKTVPWRPEPGGGCPGTTWLGPDSNCYNGYAYNVTFDMSSLAATLPNDVVVGIVYNTQTYGPAPMGEVGPFNSLNVGTQPGPASIGTDDNIDSVFWNTNTASYYTDGGAAGVGVFREDSNPSPTTGWHGYGTIPIKITADPVTLQVDDDLAQCPSAGYTTISSAIAAAPANAAIQVCAGNYNEDVTVNKSLTIYGSGPASTTVSGPIGGGGATFQIAANNVDLSGFTITRDGNNTTDWNNPSLNTAGVAIQGQSISGTVIHDNVITGMRTAIDINNSNGHTVRNNVIDNNHTGMIMRNQTDNLTVVENFITNNRTVGVLFLDASGGSNIPVQTALNCTFSNNNISGNWYGQIVDRQTGGSLPAPGTTNLKNFKGNWLGTSAPIVTTANSAEPGYAVLIPVIYGGSATAPGGQPDIAGPASANFQTSPLLTSGVDTNIETTPGRGTFGFQGSTAIVTVTPAAMNGWLFYNDETDTIDNSLGTFLAGPGTTPAGIGSAQISVSGTQRRNLATYQFAGTPLSSITTLAYSTYNPSAGNGGSANRSGYLNFNVDFNGSDTWQRRLVFLPVDNGTVVQNSWQEWDGVNGGNALWRYSGATWPAGIGEPGTTPGSTTKTWSQILSTYPGVRIRVTDAFMGIRVGEPYADGYTENIDLFKFGTSAYTTNFDFEPVAVTATIDQAAGQPDPTNVGPINFTVTFSEPVTGFTDSDVVLGGPTGATTAVVTGGPTVYNVAVTGMTSDGALTATIGAGAATSIASGAPNQASTSADNSVYFVATCNAVSIPTNITTLTGQPVSASVNVDDLTGRGVLSTDFTVTYDPTKLTYVSTDLGSVDAGATPPTVNSGTPGILVVSIYSASPFTGAGTLATLHFTAIGAPATSSPLTFSGFVFNEGVPCVGTTNGLISILSGTISGTVSYGNAVGSPAPPRHVPGVALNATGSIPVSTNTASDGTYSLSGMGAGAYDVTPSKTGGTFSAISGLDSSYIATYVVGLAPGNTINAAQQSVADVSGNGSITSFDAALIARYVASLPGSGTTGTWKFVPTSIHYADVNANQTGQDYSALLMGDVTGNWFDPSATLREPVIFTGKPLIVTAPILSAPVSGEVSIPIGVQDTTGKGILSYQFDLRYDPKVLEPAAVPTDIAGTISEGYNVTVNPLEPGVLRVVVFGVQPLAGEGQLINLRFNVVGSVDSSSDLIWENFVLNEGNVYFQTVNGRVQVTAASNNASINGRVLTTTGQGVANARVTITDTNGQVRNAITGSFGMFQFGDLQVGQTYTISVASKRYTFAPQTVSVTGDAVSVDLIALP